MLSKKLHVKPGMHVGVVNAPGGFSLGPVPDGATVGSSLARGLDLVLLFATSQKALAPPWRKALTSVKPEGAIWVAYPKKSSGIESDLAMMDEWDLTKGSGWAPVSMVAVDETWSAVRFRHAPGLDDARAERQEEQIRDADGTVVIDRKTRVITPPKELGALFKKNAKARAAFEALAFSHRREYVTWIIDAKRPETRAARLTKTIDMLSRGKKNPSDK